MKKHSKSDNPRPLSERKQPGVEKTRVYRKSNKTRPEIAFKNPRVHSKSSCLNLLSERKTICYEKDGIWERIRGTCYPRFQPTVREQSSIPDPNAQSCSDWYGSFLFGKQMALLFLLTTISRRNCRLILVWGSCWVRQEFGTRPRLSEARTSSRWQKNSFPPS